MARPEQSEAEREKGRARGLAKRFGGTAEQWLEWFRLLFEKQEGLCGFCGKPGERLSSRKQAMVVDHSHKRPFVVRGLMHAGCNKRLTERLEDYLATPPAVGLIDHVIPDDRIAAMTRRADMARTSRQRRKPKETPGERATYTYPTRRSVIDELDEEHTRGVTVA